MSAIINDGVRIRTAKNASDPAFPNSAGDHGLTIRDWFAGQALAGLLGKRWDGMPSDFDVIKQHAAKISFEYADAMLAERSKQ